MTISEIFTKTVTITEKGFFYDFSGLTGNDDDYVETVPDLSGNNLHLSQSVAAKRPKIITVSGKRGIKFDKVNDFLSSAALNLAGAECFTLVIAAKYKGAAGAGIILEHGVPSVSGGWGIYCNNGAAGYGAGIGLGAGNYLFVNDPENRDSRYSVMTSIIKPQAVTKKIDIRMGGQDTNEQIIAQTGATNNSVFGNRSLFIGARNGASEFSELELFGIFGIAREVTQAELQAIEAWAASLLPPDAIQFHTRNHFAFENTTHQVSRDGYIETSPYATVTFETEAEIIQVDTTSTMDIYPGAGNIAVHVDGQFYQNIPHPANGNRTTEIQLPPGDKDLTIVNSGQSKPAGNIIGSFFKAIRADKPLRTPYSGEKALIYGDSIAIGANATDSQNFGWATLLRADIPVCVEGWGYRSLSDDAQNIYGLADKIAAYAPTKIWLAIGTNDYGLSKMSANNFGIAYAALLSHIHSLCPDSTIYAQSPLLRSSEGANSLGSTLAQYRSEIYAASASRNYVVFVDGTEIMTLADLNDGVHPNDVGFGKYYAYAKDKMGL